MLTRFDMSFTRKNLARMKKDIEAIKANFGKQEGELNEKIETRIRTIEDQHELLMKKADKINFNLVSKSEQSDEVLRVWKDFQKNFKETLKSLH